MKHKRDTKFGQELACRFKVIFHKIEGGYKIWGEIDLSFQN